MTVLGVGPALLHRHATQRLTRDVNAPSVDLVERCAGASSKSIDDVGEQLLALSRWSVTFQAVVASGAFAASLMLLTSIRREREARSNAVKAVRLRDAVVSGVAHELRNPLNAIGMASRLLSKNMPDRDDGGTCGKQLATIDRAGESMARIIADLLDVARIESTGLALERTKIDVPSLLSDAASLLRPVVEAHDQRFVCRCSADLPVICGDRQRLLQVFSNLVGNAVKFTPRGGAIALAAEPAGDGVKFSVTDTGAGMPANQLPYLFDPFWQASRSDGRGLGLGLTIVRSIVEAHRSQVEVETTLGGGSTFRFKVTS